ncbi:MAG: hypothetical protein IJ468_03765 [Lachnospiraceae bacterium]|nr:hypothetical protein [Lachnospiraceae bacterium]
MRKRKSYLPEQSRKMIGDRLFDLIFILIAFGICFFTAGAVLGLEPGETTTLQYCIAGSGATLPILWRFWKKAGARVDRIVLVMVWAAAVLAVCAVAAGQ